MSYLNISLSLQNYDATSWAATTDGTVGVWFGIGFNSAVMTPANVVVCEFMYTGAATGSISCLNGYNPNPTHKPTTFPDPTADITNVTTTQA